MVCQMILIYKFIIFNNFSRDITVQTPVMGQYYLTLVVYEDIHELLMTAIMDTPPDERQAAFTIRRMGHLAH